METTLPFRLAAAFVQGLAWLLQWPMRVIGDLPGPERIGIDKPSLFERILLKLFKYREITKPSNTPWIRHGNGMMSKVVDHEVLYLRRFFLTPAKWPFRVFLHHIVQSDDARDPHDHPWNFTTCPIKGDYLESIDLNIDGSGEPADYRHVQAGERYDNPAEHVHQVNLRKPMRTLVVAGPARRMWGFVLPTGKHVAWREYLALPDAVDWPEDVIRSDGAGKDLAQEQR